MNDVDGKKITEISFAMLPVESSQDLRDFKTGPPVDPHGSRCFRLSLVQSSFASEREEVAGDLHRTYLAAKPHFASVACERTCEQHNPARVRLPYMCRLYASRQTAVTAVSVR